MAPRVAIAFAALALGLLLYAVDGAGVARIITALPKRPAAVQVALPSQPDRPQAATPTAPQPAAASPAQPLDTLWEQRGGTVPLNRPIAIAVDRMGNVYVAEHDSAMVQKFDSTGTFVTAWGGEGIEEGRFVFRGPIEAAGGIDVDENGRVYVVDDTGRVQVFEADGTYLRTMRPTSAGTEVIRSATGIRISGDGFIYVSDAFMNVSETANSQVHKLTPDGSVAKAWGEPGTSTGRLLGAGGVDVDADGNVYVADRHNHRIQVFDADGRVLRAWGRAGQGDGEFLDPTGVAVDRLGNVYVADSRNDRIQKFDDQGRYLAQGGSRGTGAGQLLGAARLAVDDHGDIIVIDAGGRRIQKVRLP
jgi:sugar lactone lactonase YvrE